ncbi:hypothetical protein J5837_02865 [Pseudoxanthomonas helianthi]|uniref:Uncharacterized protein n=1 Tax=Pseudoxanthomonas helianthi TaxID=1453541 RepID=A0A940X308_9GAMM|nr:hypothetical protein [Pseudoxanthomonas helianthi]MBP3983353.1 hypothetical protein [Pseudoxanthomonas helianthi]
MATTAVHLSIPLLRRILREVCAQGIALTESFIGMRRRQRPMLRQPSETVHSSGASKKSGKTMAVDIRGDASAIAGQGVEGRRRGVLASNSLSMDAILDIGVPHASR